MWIGRALCGLAVCLPYAGALADDTGAPSAARTAWIIELGGYGVFEPTYFGSRHYTGSIKPQIDIREEGDKEWLSFPNDAIDYNLYETDTFRFGPAANIALQSRLHGQDIDLRLGKADVSFQGGAFAEYYPVSFIRTRAEAMQGFSGNEGLLANFSADYVWTYDKDITLTFGPRAQVVNAEFASDYFSQQIAYRRHNVYAAYKAEGGLFSSGGEFTGKYDVSPDISAKLFLDYTQLVGSAAQNARTDLKSTPDQVVFGIGASYKLTILP